MRIFIRFECFSKFMNENKYETLFRKELPRGYKVEKHRPQVIRFALFEEPTKDFPIASLEVKENQSYLFLYANYMTDSPKKFCNSMHKLVHNLNVAKKLGFQDEWPSVQDSDTSSLFTREIYTQEFKPVTISDDSKLIKIIKTINNKFKT